MPPKPRPVRKVSSATAKDGSSPSIPPKDTTNPSMSMPPPPDPVPPLGILEGEVTALSACLQSAVVKTGQIYGFYTDVKRLGIQQYSPRPPRSLTMSLRREIIKYDQFCDAMESHLLRAIAVLQRDIAREEARIKAEEEAAAAAAAAARKPSPTMPTGATPPGSPSQSAQPEVLPDGTIRPRRTSVGVTPVRRQSTISLTSLSRPAPPPKLDLSASALRINPDEMMIPSSGFPSPVGLGPRSSRAPSLAPDLMLSALADPASRPVDIDLTVDDDMDSMAAPRGGATGHLNPSFLGSSADKPIELDLDIDMELLNGGGGNGATMFSAHPMGAGAHADMVKPKEEQMDMDLLNAFQSVSSAGGSDGDIFASLGGASAGGAVPGGSSQPQPSDSQKAPAAAPSPATLLAGFASAVAGQGGDSGAMESGSLGFDLDMSSLDSNFFGDAPSGPDVDMMAMDIFNMGVPPSSSASAGPSNAPNPDGGTS